MQSQVGALGNPFVTPNGEVFFCDRENHRVRKILRTGQTVTIAGTGHYGYNGDDQPATQAQLKSPVCVVVSSRNEVYISEAIGYRIRKILTNGNIVTVAGTGEGGYNGDGIPATEAQISAPFGIFVTEHDELYIADHGNNRIRKVFNGIITTVVDKVLGPSSVFVSKSNEIYICEYRGRKITKVNANGTLSTIAGTGIAGYNGDGMLATSAQFNDPWVMTVANDEVYIVDLGNNRIRKILKNGIISTIAGRGSAGYNGEEILATNAPLNSPTGVFVTDSNEIYISEYYGCRIRKINSHGFISTIAGNGTKGYSGDVPFDFEKYPHIGPRKKQLIKPFPKSYLDISIQCQME